MCCAICVRWANMFSVCTSRLAWPTRSDMPKRVTIILAVLATRSRSFDAPVVTCPPHATPRPPARKQ